MAEHIRWTASSRIWAGMLGSTSPAMPHMALKNTSPGRFRGQRRQRTGLGRPWGRSGGTLPTAGSDGKGRVWVAHGVGRVAPYRIKMTTTRLPSPNLEGADFHRTDERRNSKGFQGGE